MKHTPFGFLISFFVLSLGCLACGSSNEDQQASLSEVGSSAGALFASTASADQALVKDLKRVLDSSQEVCNNLDAGPARVAMFGYSHSGRYGSNADGIMVDEDLDFCENSDGTTQTGDASVGGNRFAGFALLSAVEGNCDSGSLTMARGSGIVRSTDDYMPEIYGQFEFNGVIANCTLRLDSTGAIDTAHSSCNRIDDESSIDLTTSSSCSITADIDHITIPATIEGHYAVSIDHGLDVSYDCRIFFPIASDADGFTTITSDCTTYNNYGFNLEGVNVGLVVGGTSAAWEIYLTTDLLDLSRRIKLMRNAGYPILASIDVLYVETFNGSNWEVIADGADFPQALIDNETFQRELSEEIIEIAQLMEQLNVEMLAPLSESDRVFNLSTTTDPDATFLQDLLPQLQLNYTGKLVWIAQAVDSTSTSTYNFDGFDYAGINVSPRPGDTPTSFTTHVQTQLGNLRTVANSFSIPYFITNAGIWGEALTSSTYDWNLDSSRVLAAFTTMRDESETYGTEGIMFWEGASGEVVFGDYSSLSQYIATEFGGDASAFE